MKIYSPLTTEERKKYDENGEIYEVLKMDKSKTFHFME